MQLADCTLNSCCSPSIHESIPSHTHTITHDHSPTQVHEVKEAQQGRMDRLMHENSELRKRLLHRTEQYHSYKSSVERSQVTIPHKAMK